MTPEEIETARRLRAEGVPHKEVAARLGYHRNTIWVALTGRKRHRRRKPPPRVDLASVDEALRADGTVYRELNRLEKREFWKTIRSHAARHERGILGLAEVYAPIAGVTTRSAESLLHRAKGW